MQYLNKRLSAAMWSRVLLLWLILALGSLVVGATVVGMGQFIQGNVRAELASQQITFPPADRLSDAERAISGMVENAGEPLTTGNQARAYSEYIGLHMQQSAERAGYPGEVYATLGGIQRQYRAEVAAAEEANDEAALEEAQAELDTVSDLRNTMLTGSTLRGNLLSAYGWDNVATGVTVAGVAILILSIVFFGLFFYERKQGHLDPA